MITDFRLLVFVTVARELSFTRAAELLSVSQPAVTKHIKELERLLATPLFRRNGNRIALRAEAEQLLPKAKQILEAYQQINDLVDDANGDYAGNLRIGASSTITQYIIPEILAKFRKRYPKIQISLMSGNSEEILREVECERVDIAIVEDAHTSSSFHYELFRNDRLVLLSAKEPKGKISLQTLQKLPLVLRENGSGTLDVIERELHRYNIPRKTLNVEIQIGSSEGIVRYLKSSAAYAFMSESAARDYIDRKELHVVEIEDFKLNRSLRFVSLHGMANRLADLFREFALNN